MQTALLVSALSFILLHPVHISISNFEYNEKEQKAEVLLKLFKGDFATILNTKYNLDINKDNKTHFIKHQDYILKYFKENFQLYADQKQIKKVNFKSLEIDKESIWINFTIENVSPFSKLVIINSLLLDLYNDQTNLVIFKLNDFQQGYSLDTEKRYVEIEIP